MEDAHLQLPDFKKLEKDILAAGKQRDAAKLRSLLAEEFCEFGSSGRVYNLEQAVDELLHNDIQDIDIEWLQTKSINAESVLVTYRAKVGNKLSLRSSLWLCQNGEWKLHFHQGTGVAE